ncbi:MAG: NAD(P)H-binding protein [Myxococcales bacterium]|jgi:uncharacterized protein YbjT (DUF2867 family)
MSTAIVIGATGLVGKSLIQQLLADPAYSSVVALTRRATERRADKYQEHVVDFGRSHSYAEWLKGDVLFSALGTTRGQAGSVAAQRTVDYTYQFEVAKIAANQGVKTYVLVSSSGASPSSLSAYMKMKGELERDVQALAFSSLHILQPGLLTGAREQSRFGEAIAEPLLGVFNAIGLFRSMKPISGEQVARAMRRAATLAGKRTHGPSDVFSLAE